MNSNFFELRIYRCRSTILVHSSSACPFRSPIHPPMKRSTGTLVAAHSTPKLQLMVPHPARSLMRPAERGPIMLPVANALLKRPYACAVAPLLPKIPGRSFSFSSTVRTISVNTGVTTKVIERPMRARSAQRSTSCSRLACVTNRSRTKNGTRAKSPPAAGIRGPCLSVR